MYPDEFDQIMELLNIGKDSEMFEGSSVGTEVTGKLTAVSVVTDVDIMPRLLEEKHTHKISDIDLREDTVSEAKSNHASETEISESRNTEIVVFPQQIASQSPGLVSSGKCGKYAAVLKEFEDVYV